MNILEKHLKLLSISKEKIEFNLRTVFYETELGWNPQEKKWIINYRDEDVQDYYFAHELGHIHLAKIKTNFLGFALPSRASPEMDRNLLPLTNQLLDPFVDHVLTQFDELYRIYRDFHFANLKGLDDFKEKNKNNDDVDYMLSLYFFFYLEFNFNIKKKERETIIKEINGILEFLKNVCIKYEYRLNTDWFEMINSKLNAFEEIKNTSNHIKILNFMIEILREVPYSNWTPDYLKKQFKIIFPQE